MSHIIDHGLSARRRPTFRITDLFALARQRRDLARLDATRLEDLGLTHEDAMQETARPFWDVPAHWMR